MTDDLKAENQRLSAELDQVKKELEVAKRTIKTKEIELKAVMAQADEVSHVDELTCLSNRRQIIKDLQNEVIRAERYETLLSISMIDIDHFKLINDSYGHAIGDRVLKKIADIFSSTARSYDMVSRIGGEEFLVICSRSTLAESKQLAERLRQAIHSLRIRLDGNTIQATISLGVASWHEDMVSGEDMTKMADGALYRAKQQGRNRVEIDAYPGHF